MVTAVRNYRDFGVRMIIFDEAHIMLAGGFREQRRILAHLRYLSNKLRMPLACLRIAEAPEAIAGDPQLARRFSLVELPAWELDSDFKGLVATLLKNLPLRHPSTLDTQALQTILRNTRGNTARIFQMISDLAVDAIATGEERITSDAIARWQPSLFERTLVS